MFLLVFTLSLASAVFSGPVTENYKDQYCTDPRTMERHRAYSEWADAYSCTRHRCQPGGRNLAIYTVGCKRVEAPESAIECEKVVEDTNMQFPFCCTRLRCLVLVRGEVWTRVLGQPWETLPSAPWSHMYKMKKPPPSNGSMLPKNIHDGPIYELAEVSESDNQKVLRASKKTSDEPDCNDDQKPVPVPDIVIALATESDKKVHKKSDMRHKVRKTSADLTSITDDDSDKEQLYNEVDFEDAVVITEKVPEASDEKDKTDGVTRKTSSKVHQASWTEIPEKEWNELDVPQTDSDLKDSGHLTDVSEEKGKPALQALVDAIGTRMRDIENVVQKMSEKVHLQPGETSSEKRMEADGSPPRTHHKETKEHKDVVKPKAPSPDADQYKRFHGGHSKYLRSGDVTSEPPLFVEDSRLNGYFSDASNSVLRRGLPKEPALTYMAPVDTHRKSHAVMDSSDEVKKHKKHHKKGKGHKRHHKDKRKRFNRLSSAELDKNANSLEDSVVANI